MDDNWYLSDANGTVQQSVSGSYQDENTQVKIENGEATFIMSESN